MNRLEKKIGTQVSNYPQHCQTLKMRCRDFCSIPLRSCACLRHGGASMKTQKRCLGPKVSGSSPPSFKGTSEGRNLAFHRRRDRRHKASACHDIRTATLPTSVELPLKENLHGGNRAAVKFCLSRRDGLDRICCGFSQRTVRTKVRPLDPMLQKAGGFVRSRDKATAGCSREALRAGR